MAFTDIQSVNLADRVYVAPAFRQEQARRTRARWAREEQARREAKASRFAAKGNALAAAFARAGVVH